MEKIHKLLIFLRENGRGLTLLLRWCPQSLDLLVQTEILFDDDFEAIDLCWSEGNYGCLSLTSSFRSTRL